MVFSNSKLFICLVILSICLHVSRTDDCSTGPCFPTPNEIKAKFEVKSNSTCGEDGEERYCTPTDQACNTICNATVPNLKHPPSYVNDALDTFWKSKNVEQPVYLQMDFGSIFMIYVSAVKFHFELPAAVYLAKSIDYGKTFHPLTYFATYCTKFFNMTTTAYSKRNGLAVECFLIDKQIMPSKQIDYQPMQDRKTSQGIRTSHQNQSYFLMTNIRLMLENYVTPERFDINTASENLKRGLSFSVEDWSIQAACYCNGQASTCQNDTHCVCKRNTAGRNCEKCLPLYNNRPYEIWQACQDCGCNNHAQSCQYNATKGYGVCDNCIHNTTGDKCELCKIEHYRNSAVMKNHSKTCLPCACDLNGVLNVWNRTDCHPTTGQCQCKSRVQGRACDLCKPSFWNLQEANPLGCEACACDLNGVLNTDCHPTTGQCQCKSRVHGRACDICKPTYWNLQESNPLGCEGI